MIVCLLLQAAKKRGVSFRSNSEAEKAKLRSASAREIRHDRAKVAISSASFFDALVECVDLYVARILCASMFFAIDQNNPVDGALWYLEK
jgi:hypothetical protein